MVVVHRFARTPASSSWSPTHIHAHVRTLARSHALTYSLTHTRTHTYTHTPTHTHTHAHTYTHRTRPSETADFYWAFEPHNGDPLRSDDPAAWGKVCVCGRVWASLSVCVSESMGMISRVHGDDRD